MLLLDLPADILLAVFAAVSVSDLLSLSQTCRVLHAFVGNDYIWHSIQEPLPLDITGEIVDIHAFSGAELQKSFVRALRLERNWRKPSPTINVMERIDHGDIVFQIQFLGSHLLLTLARSPVMVYMSLWNIGKPSLACRIASFDVPSATAFAASLIKHDQEVIIVVLSRAPSLSVYSVSLQSNGTETVSPRLLSRIARPKTEGTPYEVHMNGHVVAAAIAHFGDAVTPTYRILFFNIDTAVQVLLDPDLPMNFKQLHFQISPHHLVISGEVQNRFIIRYHDISDLLARMNKGTNPGENREETLGEPIKKCQTFEIRKASRNASRNAESDYSLSVDFQHGKLPNVTTVSFHSLSNSNTVGAAFVFFFRPNGPSAEEVTGHRFNTPPSAVADIVCAGRCGRRAIWMERRWDTDVFTLMKATFYESKAEVSGLMSSQLALPFEMHACQSIMLDEATGRVCLGLHTGEVYLMQF